MFQNFYLRLPLLILSPMFCRCPADVLPFLPMWYRCAAVLEPIPENRQICAPILLRRAKSVRCDSALKCLLLLKSEASMNKEKHSLRNFAALQSGGGTQRNSSLPQTWLFWYKRNTFWKWHCLRRMALESKRLHQNNWYWCHFAGKKNVLLINALTYCDLFPDFF